MRNRILLVLLLAVLTNAAQNDSSPAGQTISLHKQSGNVLYDVMLVRGTELSIVSTNYRFQSGDRFALRVMPDADSYVYLLSRTLAGPLDELRAGAQGRLPADGLSAGEEHDRSKAPRYVLVYPPSGHRLLKAGQVGLAPGQNMALEMDEGPGAEQLLLVVSPVKLDLSGAQGYPDGNAGLLRQLATMEENAEVEDPPAEVRKVVLEAPPDPRAADPVPPSNARPLQPAGRTRSAPPNSITQPIQAAAPKRRHQPYLVNILLSRYPAAQNGPSSSEGGAFGKDLPGSSKK